MFSSVVDTRPRRKLNRADRSPFASSYARTATPPRHARLQYNQRRTLRYEDEEQSSTGTSENNQGNDAERELHEGGTDEDEDQTASPLLPIFDSAHLDTLPIYTLTHMIRIMVISRCETVLTWEQLRSPQVSQFLLKPIQQQIQTNHFSAATIYCLMANCLQFTKEVASVPGNSGTNQTRAMICELLAVKLLREYTTRGLIDALSYDFDPLQGQSDIAPPTNVHRPSWQSMGKRQPSRSARISCLEIAIRAQAKRFLAHPVVVRQLEAIWDGSIVFHTAADEMHRAQPRFKFVNYGATGQTTSKRPQSEAKSMVYTGSRKVVTLYNPRDASLFKLSRLRVPRYRNALSTLSFAILLGLFVAVLVQRSVHITSLEIVFWVWAGGFMVDELVGVTEQGFGLYIASFWNTMDLGIILLLLIHLCLRIYGIVMPDIKRQYVAGIAYEILATDAILLFPRLFSVLDHYRYFSQLIIAFRLMAADAVAIFVLILIACSGFFVALSLSFGYGSTESASGVAYALLQMVFGFTPAVWDRWDAYNPLGRFILSCFLFLAHFLILTILITVLTNSFMAVIKNANEEHQFIFAVNTISSVKSDALFSYVPPLNVLQWLLHPLRYIVPFKQYVKINRTVIKITHFPVLLTIYVYEKTFLQSAVVDSIDVVENRHSARSAITQRFHKLVKEASKGNLRQDQALEEVFKQPFDATIRTDILNRKETSTVVNQWMHDMGQEGVNSPQEDDPRTVGRLERTRLGERSLSTFSRARRSSQKALSVASDPTNFPSHADFFSPQVHMASVLDTPSHVELDNQEAAADGDDEMQTIDNDDDYHLTTDMREARLSRPLPPADYFSRRSSPMNRTQIAGSLGSGSRNLYSTSNSGRASPLKMVMHKRPDNHNRNFSSATMIFNPPAADNDDENPQPPTASHSRPMTPGSKRPSAGSGKKTPKLKQPSHLRPMFPHKDDPAFRSAPNLHAIMHGPQRALARRSSLEMDLVSDIGDNKAIGGGYVGAIPASFAPQMAYVTDNLKNIQRERKEEQEMFGRLMMARMNTLEEGFREVIHEVRENMRPGSKNRSPERPTQVRREKRAMTKGKEKADSSGNLTPDIGSSRDVDVDPKASVVTVVPSSRTRTLQEERYNKQDTMQSPPSEQPDSTKED